MVMRRVNAALMADTCGPLNGGKRPSGLFCKYPSTWLASAPELANGGFASFLACVHA